MAYQAPKGGFRTFLIIWLSQSVSVFGSALTYFAVNIWLVESAYPLPEQRSQLAWALAALGIAWSLPYIAFTPLAGALADRHDRKRIMLCMDVTNGILSALTAALMASGRLNIWLLLILISLSGLAGSVHGSAFDASYAMLVTDEQLPRANGMMQTMGALSSLLSPAAAAALITLPAIARRGSLGGALGGLLAPIKEGAALAIGIDAATFLLAAAVLAPLFVPSPHRAELHAGNEDRPSVWADIRFGLTFLWHRRPLFWLLVTFAACNLCTQDAVFLPLIVKTGLAPDWTLRGFSYETALAAVNMALSAGGVIGGVIVSLWGGARQRRLDVLLATILFGAFGQMAMGLSPWLYGTMAAAAALAFTGPFGNAHSQAIWQAQVPRELQGRVFGVRRTLSQGVVPLGVMLGGWLCTIVAPGVAMALLGGVVGIVAVIALLSPQLRRVEDSEYLDRLAREAV